MTTGVFVISLDLELHWGVSDQKTIDEYRENLVNEPRVSRRLLQLFREKDIHATWATVGMLFCRNKEELFAFVKPEHRPTYLRTNVSNYVVAKQAGNNEEDDPFHYASSLVREIIETPHQEMATHTYSHYYCLEPGQTGDQFFYDLDAAKQIAGREHVNLSSIVFPANQFRKDYLQQCKMLGIKCYRGNYPSWIYQFNAKSSEGPFKRMARLIDTYLPLKGHRCVEPVMEEELLNIPASCFLRPYQPKLSLFESLRISRMKKEMEAAAKRKQVYHLWWHPHNFGRNFDRNFSTLEKILDHYKMLEKKYNMRSLNMEEIYHLISLSK